MKFLTDLDLSKNEIQNAAIHNLATDPASGVAGQVYYNTADKHLYIYNGTAWIKTPISLTDLGLTATATEMNYVDGVTSAIQAQLNAKAPVASPTFTGEPKSTTPISGDNSTKIATTAFVQGALGSGGYGDMMKSTYDSDNDGVVNSAATLSGLTATVSELNFVSGANSSIQDQLDGKAQIASPIFTGNPKSTTPDTTDNSTNIATTAYVKAAIQGVSGGMSFKGVANAGADISGLTGYTAGDNWIVGTAGEYAGQTCEIGDWIICKNDRGASFSASDFNVIQANIIGQVTAGANLTDGYLVEGNGTKGLEATTLLAANVVSTTDTIESNEIVTGASSKAVKGSGISISSASIDDSSVKVPTNSAVQAYIASLNLATVVSESNDVLTADGGGSCSWTITHDLGTKDVTVSVYEVTSGDEIVCDIKRSSTSAVLIKIIAASVPAGTYRAVITGVKAS